MTMFGRSVGLGALVVILMNCTGGGGSSNVPDGSAPLDGGNNVDSGAADGGENGVDSGAHDAGGNDANSGASDAATGGKQDAGGPCDSTPTVVAQVAEASGTNDFDDDLAVDDSYVYWGGYPGLTDPSLGYPTQGNVVRCSKTSGCLSTSPELVYQPQHNNNQRGGGMVMSAGRLLWYEYQGAFIDMDLSTFAPDAGTNATQCPWGADTPSADLFWFGPPATNGTNDFINDSASGQIVSFPRGSCLPTDETLICSGAQQCGGVVMSIVATASTVYWTEWHGGTATFQFAGSIRSCPVSGCPMAPTMLVATTSGSKPAGLAIDATSLYWTDAVAGTVMKAALDGTNAVTLATGQQSPTAIVVDASNVYWLNLGASGWGTSINRVPIAGGTPHQLAGGGQLNQTFAIDDSCLYYAVSYPASILKVAK